MENSIYIMKSPSEYGFTVLPERSILNLGVTQIRDWKKKFDHHFKLMLHGFRDGYYFEPQLQKLICLSFIGKILELQKGLAYELQDEFDSPFKTVEGKFKYAEKKIEAVINDPKQLTWQEYKEMYFI